MLDRFRNPFIKHQLRSIALNSVSKFAVRVLPTILEYKERSGAYPPALTLSLAFLIFFYKNDTVQDVPEVMSFMKEASLDRILANERLWGCDLTDMYGQTDAWLKIIAGDGAAAAMERVVR